MPQAVTRVVATLLTLTPPGTDIDPAPESRPACSTSCGTSTRPPNHHPSRPPSTAQAVGPKPGGRARPQALRRATRRGRYRDDRDTRWRYDEETGRPSRPRNSRPPPSWFGLPRNRACRLRPGGAAQAADQDCVRGRTQRGDGRTPPAMPGVRRPLRVLGRATSATAAGPRPC